MNLTRQQQYYQEQKLLDPNYVKKIHQNHLKRINEDRKLFAKHKFTKQMSSAKRTRNIPWRLDRDKTVSLIEQAKQCATSGRILVFQVGHPDSPSIDRINSRLGYTKSNIQIVSSAVNRAKMDMSDQEFLQLCLDVVKHNGYRVCAK